jgi:osmotically inducible lipoprotein OsmB
MLRASIAVGLFGLILASACGTKAGDTLTGSAIGAGAGAAIGSTMGETKKGAAAGGAAGALGGYLAHEAKDD